MISTEEYTKMYETAKVLAEAEVAQLWVTKPEGAIERKMYQLDLVARIDKHIENMMDGVKLPMLNDIRDAM